MKTVIVTFDGTYTTIETTGFSGSECQKDTADLKRELGLTELVETPTREAYARTDTKQEVRRGR